MMRFLLPALLVLAATSTLHAADTAYGALRVFGKREGEQALYRVVEVRGKNGGPQPTSWKLTIDDPQARGGVRELEIRSGRITSEKTPVGRDYPPMMNFNQLNLDSDGAFTVANQEAEKRGVAFDRIDYLLQSTRGGAPEWTVELYEGRSGRVATLKIAADSGAIVEQRFESDRRFAGDREYVRDEPPPRSVDRNRDRDRYSDARRRQYDRERDDDDDDRHIGESVSDFFKRVGRHFERRGRQLNNFFTGGR